MLVLHQPEEGVHGHSTGPMRTSGERTCLTCRLYGSSRPHCTQFLDQVAAHLDVKKNLQPGWSQAWLERPLDPKLLEYAVYDVLAILALYQHFEAAGERTGQHMQHQ